MSTNPNFKARVYSQNAANSRTATSNKTMMTTVIIGKESHSILMMEIAYRHKTQWKKIHSFDRHYDILRGQLGLNSVADLVTTTSYAIPTETASEYEEARKVSTVVEAAITKAEYLDDIGFLNGKGNPMTAPPNVSEKLP